MVIKKEKKKKRKNEKKKKRKKEKMKKGKKEKRKKGKIQTFFYATFTKQSHFKCATGDEVVVFKG